MLGKGGTVDGGPGVMEAELRWFQSPRFCSFPAPTRHCYPPFPIGPQSSLPTASPINPGPRSLSARLTTGTSTETGIFCFCLAPYKPIIANPYLGLGNLLRVEALFWEGRGSRMGIEFLEKGKD